MQIRYRFLAGVLAAAVFTACSPKFDWRDYRSAEAPYSALFPGKPASRTRAISLGGTEVQMNMAAADIDGTMFAIGSAELPDAAQAQAAVTAMKESMVGNIGGAVTAEKPQPGGVEVEAKGARNGEPLRLAGRFIANGKRVYQIVVVGREKHMDKEAVDTFLSSFKLN